MKYATQSSAPMDLIRVIRAIEARLNIDLWIDIKKIKSGIEEFGEFPIYIGAECVDVIRAA